MWADTIYAAERLHLLRLLVWGALSLGAATVVATTLTVRRARSPLLLHFAMQMAAWGVVIAAFAGVRLRGIALRDLSGAARLERLLWLNIGLDIGVVIAGVGLALSAWILARRMAMVGAAMAILLQAAALLLLNLELAVVVSK